MQASGLALMSKAVPLTLGQAGTKQKKKNQAQETCPAKQTGTVAMSCNVLNRVSDLKVDEM